MKFLKSKCYLPFLGFILVLISAPTLASSQTPIQKPPMMLGRGEQRFVCIPGLLSFSLGDSKARALRLPKRLNNSDCILLKGVENGTTDLWIWSKEGEAFHQTIRIFAWSQKTLPRSLVLALDQLQEVEVIPFGTRVLLRGTVRSKNELLLISELSKAHPKKVINRAQPSNLLLTESLEELRKWLLKTPYSSALSAEVLGNQIQLKGYIGNPHDQEGIKRHASLIYPLIDFDHRSSENPMDLIYFRIFLLEMKRDLAHSIGLNWPGNQTGSLSASFWNLKNHLAVDLQLKALSSEGHIRVLSRPEMVVRAPGEAELFAGGEIPIRNKGRFHSNVDWKPFGLSLKLKVLEKIGPNIRVDVFAQMSHLDTSREIDDLPSLRMNRMKTQIHAKTGEPILLSGLLHEGVRKQARGLPILRDIPVFGSLFGSEDFLKEKSELVAVLVPLDSPPTMPEVEGVPVFPKGPVPPPRNWISSEQLESLSSDPDFPWSALQ